MTAKDSRKKRRILEWAINLAGVLAFGLILYWGGAEAWQQILHGDWGYILAAFAVTMLWNLLAAYRWSLVAGQVIGEEGAACPYRYYFTYHMIGMFIGQVVPITVGMLGGRPVALSLSRGVSLRRSALSVFLDKFFDLALALLLVVPVLLYLVDWISRPLAASLMAVMVVIGALLVGWQYERGMAFIGQAGSRFSRPLVHLPLIGRRLVQRLPEQLARLSEASGVDNHLAVRSFALTLAMYALLATRLFFIAQALRLDIPWYLLAMGLCVTQLAVVFSVTPGSLGFLEGGWAAVMGLAGLTTDQFLTFVIGRRAYFLIFTLFSTLLAFGWIRESPARLFREVLGASRQPPQPKPAPDLTAAREAETTPTVEA